MGSLILAVVMAGTPAAIKINSVGFMAGSWTYENNGSLYEEQWMKPNAGSMLGVSRSSKDGKVRFLEFLHIQEREGKLILTLAHKLGDPAHSFEAIKADGSEVVFKSIDDPNNAVITYRKTPEGMFANVKGQPKDGQPYSLDFHFKRAAQ